jgi:hypothetical protein
LKPVLTIYLHQLEEYTSDTSWRCSSQLQLAKTERDVSLVSLHNSSSTVI